MSGERRMQATPQRADRRIGGGLPPLGWVAGIVLALQLGCGVPALLAGQLLGWLPGSAAATEEEILERVVAAVEDQPILYSEVRGRLAMELEQLGIDPGDSAAVAEVRDELIESMINERVLQLEAEKIGFQVSDEEIAREVDAAIERNKRLLGSEEMFQLQLEREGYTEEELRQRFAQDARRQILATRLLQSEVGRQIEVTPEEVREYFEQNRAELPQRDAAVHLQRIVVLVKPDSTVLMRTRALAEDVAAEIRAGEISFADAARRYSDDPNSRDGGDLHRIRRGDLAGRLGEAFEEEVFSLPSGEITPPLRSPLGYHLVMAHERADDGSWVHLSHILFSVPVLQADIADARRRARQIREQLLAGRSFEELAREFSDGPAAAEGGDLGWLPAEALEEPLRAALEGLARGEPSEVVEIEGAFLILRHLGREAARAYAFEEIEAELTELVRQMRMEEAYSRYVERLKRDYYIERRPWE